MKYAIAVHGTRGDVEPATAVALELLRRGHEVRMAVPPNLVAFAESAGIPPPVLPYGTDSQLQLEADGFRDWWKLRNPLTVVEKARELMIGDWPQMGETLAAMATDADLILTGTTYQEVAANVAESRDIPMAALHYFPARTNTKILPVRLPLAVVRPAWAVAEWALWRILKPAEDDQRRRLGLPAARSRSVNRIVGRSALEIQAYDEVFFPGLDAEWGGTRPLVGAITLQMSTAVDDAVATWIADGTPPIYFGFGSMPIENPAKTIAMITEVSADLGERALICSGVLDVANAASADHVKIVRSVNHAAVFPQCRAIVHHGGAGTTAASVRSGRPTLVLWVGAEQPLWANSVKRLGVGTMRRFSKSTAETMRADLRSVLSPTFIARAQTTAALMTPPDRSLATAARLLEQAAKEH
ncbi:MAG: glycosyltransferase [Mycobacterium sp.]